MQRCKLILLKTLPLPALVLVVSMHWQPSEAQIIRKTLVEFYSSDSLLVAADHYYFDTEKPYIVLLHQEQSSRGEFDSIAERFVKMQYNCLAVDLRAGDEFGFVDNVSAARAREQNLAADFKAIKDISAALNFAFDQNGEPAILLGSSYSASLALKIAGGNEKVKSVMAFSPGEFFTPTDSLRNFLEPLNIPVFIASNPQEYPYLHSMLAELNNPNINLFSPVNNSLGRGVELLFDSNPSSREYWLSLLIFIKALRD